MKKYLVITIFSQNFEIDLDIIKQYHVQFLAESNKVNFGIERTNLNSAKRVTEALFSNNTYALNWINRNLKWEHIENHIQKKDNLQLDYHNEWLTAVKDIITKPEVKKSQAAN